MRSSISSREADVDFVIKLRVFPHDISAAQSKSADRALHTLGGVRVNSPMFIDAASPAVEGRVHRLLSQIERWPEQCCGRPRGCI